MDTNKVDSSPSQTMEEQINAPSNSPTLQLNGLQAESILGKQHLPALKVAGHHFPLPPKPPNCDKKSGSNESQEPSSSTPLVIGSGSQQLNIPITLQTLDDL